MTSNKKQRKPPSQRNTAPDNLPQIPGRPLEQHFPGGFTVRDEANAIVAYAFRNGPLENLHAGRASPLLEDPSLSRITDQEMKELMLNACEHIEKLLRLKETDPEQYATFIRSYNFRYCGRWQR